MAPELILLLILLVALAIYAVLGGADFGAGVWEFNTALRASEAEKRLIYHAIGPVWEANHVWLIFVLVGLFSGFPAAFSALSQALWIPLLLGLLGIVFRGAAYAFRAYVPGPIARRGWESVFAVASVCAPYFFGLSVGAIASGSLAVSENGVFMGSFLTGWIHWFGLYCGFFAVGICAYLAAVFLTREAERANDAELARTWRRRALMTGSICGCFSVIGIVMVAVGVPLLREGFVTRAWPWILVSMTAGVASLAMLVQRRYIWASWTAMLTVGAVVLGWGFAQYPYLIPPHIDVDQVKAPDNAIIAYLVVIGIGVVLLAPALGLLFYLFKFRVDDPSAP